MALKTRIYHRTTSTTGHNDVASYGRFSVELYALDDLSKPVSQVYFDIEYFVCGIVGEADCPDLRPDISGVYPRPFQSEG